MKKLILIIFILVFLSNNVVANDLSVEKFHEWLFENGHTEYVNIVQKEGCKKLIQKHGLKVPKVGLIDEPKVKTNEWFWLGCHKFQFTNNLKRVPTPPAPVSQTMGARLFRDLPRLACCSVLETTLLT